MSARLPTSPPTHAASWHGSWAVVASACLIPSVFQGEPKRQHGASLGRPNICLYGILGRYFPFSYFEMGKSR